jgi:probable O-glycosylation ligase (exosortase A-associated)
MITSPELTAPPGWWRRSTTAPAVSGRVERTATPSSGSNVAFGALVTFTAILLLSPQIWFPILGSMRIAFLAAGTAIAAHLLDRLTRGRDVPPAPREIVIAMSLVAWAVLTLPLSYWPAGSVEVLADKYVKAIAFFWLIGTLVTTSDRLRILAWTLVLCSIPLAATGVKNYFVGQVLSTGVRGFTRIYGYAGGSGLTGNPNDLALMLNLIIPIAAALVWMSRRPAARLVAAGALVLSIAAVIVTFSRAGFLTLAASGLMFMVILVRRRAAGAAAGLLVLALAALPLLPEGYAARLSTITDIEADATGSARGRWKDTQVAVDVVVQNPIIGVGIGQDILAMNSERGAKWRRIHNAYLQYGVDLGIPGLLLFVWLHVMCFKSARAVEMRAARDPARRHLGYLAAGVQASLVAFGVAALFHPIAYQFYFFSVAGLAVALKHTCRAEIASPTSHGVTETRSAV